MDDQYALNESRLSMARTKSTFPAQLTSQTSLQTLANFDDPKSNLRESSRIFKQLNTDSVDSPQSSHEESMQHLETQILTQRTRDQEGANQLKSELDQFIGLLQKVKQPEPLQETQLKTNLSVIISTDESLTSKQSPAQEYYSFTNQNSGLPSQQQSQQDLTESRESDSFKKLVTQKSEIIQEGFKRCMKALIQVCKQSSFVQALPWIDKLAAIQIVQMQQTQKHEEQIALLEQKLQCNSPQVRALKECLNQQEKEIELLQKQNLQKTKYHTTLENEIKNYLQEQTKDRQALAEQQSKNMQLKNLILMANRQYEELLTQLARTEEKLVESQEQSISTIKQLQQSNKILRFRISQYLARNVIITTGDEKAGKLVDVLLALIERHTVEVKQKSEGSVNARQKSESIGRTKENHSHNQRGCAAGSRALKTSNQEQQKSPLSSLRNKISEFHSAQRKTNRSLHVR